MPSTLGLTVALIVTMSVAIGASNQYKVGDADGWRSPEKNETEMYEKWATKIRFQVGDSIIFEYQNDSVVRVDKRGYYHCNESSRGLAFKDGSTVLLLDRPGFCYFVSGDFDHCKRGQRLMINVLSLTAGPSPSPLPGAAAVSYSTPSSRRALVIFAAVVIMSWRPSCNPYWPWM